MTVKLKQDRTRKSGFKGSLDVLPRLKLVGFLSERIVKQKSGHIRQDEPLLCSIKRKINRVHILETESSQGAH